MKPEPFSVGEPRGRGAERAARGGRPILCVLEGNEGAEVLEGGADGGEVKCCDCGL
jgi:hypothetical protein